MGDNQPEEVKAMTVIDFKLPLPWMLSSAALIVFSLGSLYMKIDQQQTIITQVSAKLDKRDENTTVILTTLAEVKSNNATQDAAISRNAEDIADIKRQLEKGR
jgi:septal ring factor EnvC (AmiA/AmiB activator)